MTKEEAFDEFNKFFISLRCGDNSCLFGRNGAGTNGGCMTTKLKPVLHLALQRLAVKWRELEEKVEKDNK